MISEDLLQIPLLCPIIFGILERFLFHFIHDIYLSLTFFLSFFISVFFLFFFCFFYSFIHTSFFFRLDFFRKAKTNIFILLLSQMYQGGGWRSPGLVFPCVWPAYFHSDWMNLKLNASSPARLMGLHDPLIMSPPLPLVFSGQLFFKKKKRRCIYDWIHCYPRRAPSLFIRDFCLSSSFYFIFFFRSLSHSDLFFFFFYLHIFWRKIVGIAKRRAIVWS